MRWNFSLNMKVNLFILTSKHCYKIDSINLKLYSLRPIQYLSYSIDVWNTFKTNDMYVIYMMIISLLKHELSIGFVSGNTTIKLFHWRKWTSVKALVVEHHRCLRRFGESVVVELHNEILLQNSFENLF